MVHIHLQGSSCAHRAAGLCCTQGSAAHGVCARGSAPQGFRNLPRARDFEVRPRFAGALEALWPLCIEQANKSAQMLRAALLVWWAGRRTYSKIETWDSACCARSCTLQKVHVRNVRGRHHFEPTENGCAFPPVFCLHSHAGIL